MMPEHLPLLGSGLSKLLMVLGSLIAAIAIIDHVFALGVTTDRGRDNWLIIVLSLLLVGVSYCSDLSQQTIQRLNASTKASTRRT